MTAFFAALWAGIRTSLAILKLVKPKPGPNVPDLPKAK